MMTALLVVLASLAVAPQRTAVEAPPRALQVAPPRITAVTPGDVLPGQTVELTLTGANIRNGLVVAFGPGVTATPVARATGTRGVVTVTVDRNAAAGSRALEARVGQNDVRQPAQLLVRAPALVRLAPQTRRQAPAPTTTARPPTPTVASPAPPSLASGATLLMFSGARLQYDSRFCLDQIPCLTNDDTIVVHPGDRGPQYFWWNVDRVPNATAVRWQVIYTAESPDALAAKVDPPDVVRTGIQDGSQAEVALDLDTIAKQLRITPFQPPTAAGGRAVRQTPGRSAQTVGRAGAFQARGAVTTELARSLYVRVIPLRSVAQPVASGRPSNVIRVTYGVEPPLDLTLPETTHVAGPSLAVTSFEWVPHLVIKNWPSGCEEIPRDTGKGGLDVVADAFADVWDWASKTYAQVESTVVDVAHTLLPIVPRSVLNVAMQVAMTAAGIPPSIPNLDQLMDAGSDYLAENLAAQIPIPASSELAGLTVAQFKSNARDAARQAIRAGADKARAELSGANVKYCQRWEREPIAKITIRNTGNEDYTNVTVGIGDSADLFRDLSVTLGVIHRGQELTLPIVLMDKARMNIVVKAETQLGSVNESRAESAWWDRFLSEPTAFVVTLPDGQNCSLGTCQDARKTAYRSDSKVWYNEGAVYR